MERVNLVGMYGKACLRRWRSGWSLSPFVTHIGLGRLPDGRWYVERTGRGASVRDSRDGACVYEAGERGRRLAEATVSRWQRTMGGTWMPTPAVYDAHQQPADGLAWVPRGNEWILAE